MGDVADFLDDTIDSVGGMILTATEWTIAPIREAVEDVVDDVTEEAKRLNQETIEARAAIAVVLGLSMTGLLGPVVTGYLTINAVSRAIEDPTFENVAIATALTLDAAGDVNLKLGGSLGTAITDLGQDISEATAPILQPIQDGLILVQAELTKAEAQIEEALKAGEEVRRRINEAAELKVLADLLKSTTDVTQHIQAVNEGKGFETAAAIAELLKSNITSTVGLMNRVELEYELTRASIEGAEENLRRSFREKVDLSKAEILAAVTPRLDVLGSYQEKVISGIARIYRHVEDEAWFGYMLLKVLR